MLIGDADELVDPLKGVFFPPLEHGQRRRGLRIGSDQREVLKIGSVVAHGLGSYQSQLGRDVFGGKVAAAGADSAAFQQVARKKLHVGPNALRRISVIWAETVHARRGKSRTDFIGLFLEILANLRGSDAAGKTEIAAFFVFGCELGRFGQELSAGITESFAVFFHITMLAQCGAGFRL